jgi:transposase-like protein
VGKELAMPDLRDPIFHDDEAAAKHFEAIRWPDGPYCPLCGSFDRVKPTTTPNKAHGSWYHCGSCRRRFSSTMGTVCERSHIPLTKWLLAMHLLAASKKGMSAHQLHRMLGVTYKSAWFMAMRIREAMRQLDPDVFDPMGGEARPLRQTKPTSAARNATGTARIVGVLSAARMARKRCSRLSSGREQCARCT